MLYDFRCSHGHSFDYTCKMDDRLIPIRCQGMVNQLATDEEYEKYSSDSELTLPEGLFWTTLGIDVQGADKEITIVEDDGQIEQVLMRKVPCMLQATVFTGTHNNPRNQLFHNLGANRDAAREGRYDPSKPSTRFLAKGKGWRK